MASYRNDGRRKQMPAVDAQVMGVEYPHKSGVGEHNSTSRKRAISGFHLPHRLGQVWLL